jgi:uncharacterized protein YbaR (Trm112 family)
MCLRAWALILLLLGFTMPSVQARIGDIIGICVTHYYNVAGGDTFLGKPVQAKLNTIVLHGFDFENEDIANVLKDLSEQSKRLDPEHIGVKIRLDLSASPESKNFPVRRTVNLKLGDEMCLAEALGIVCEATRLGYRIIDGVVLLEPM